MKRIVAVAFLSISVAYAESPHSNVGAAVSTAKTDCQRRADALFERANSIATQYEENPITGPHAGVIRGQADALQAECNSQVAKDGGCPFAEQYANVARRLEAAGDLINARDARKMEKEHRDECAKASARKTNSNKNNTAEARLEYRMKMEKQRETMEKSPCWKEATDLGWKANRLTGEAAKEAHRRAKDKRMECLKKFNLDKYDF